MLRLELADVPRPVRLAPGARRRIIGFVVIAACGLGLAGLVWRRIEAASRTGDPPPAGWLVAEGKILKKWRARESTPVEDAGRAAILVEFSHYAQYEFDARGLRMNGQARLPRRLYERLREGGPVAVFYDPAQPSLHRLEAAGDRARLRVAQGLFAFLAVTLVLFLIGGIAFLNGVRKELRALRDWSAREATVERVENRRGGRRVVLKRGDRLTTVEVPHRDLEIRSGETATLLVAPGEGDSVLLAAALRWADLK